MIVGYNGILTKFQLNIVLSKLIKIFAFDYHLFMAKSLLLLKNCFIVVLLLVFVSLVVHAVM